MGGDFINFVGEPIHSYQLSPSEDGVCIGLSLETKSGKKIDLALPQESSVRLIHEIDKANQICLSRKSDIKM